MKFSIIRTALLTFFAVIIPAVVVNADCSDVKGRGVPKEQLWWFKQAMVAAQRVERYGWLKPQEEFWTTGRPGSNKTAEAGGDGPACVGLGVKNEDSVRVKIDWQTAMNHWIPEFHGCDQGGSKTTDKIKYTYTTLCNKDSKNTPLKGKDEL